MFNRQVVNHLFLNTLSHWCFSPYPIIKVPVRITTTCEPQRCYWNSSIVSQTLVRLSMDLLLTCKRRNSFWKICGFLLGHGCWLNPEGELVDVSPTESNDRKFRYFLPVDRKLIRNSATEQIKTICMLIRLRVSCMT